MMAGPRLLITTLSLLTLACSLNGRPTLSPDEIAPLWQVPNDLEARDLLHGPGGRQLAPDTQSRYQFVRVKKTGTQPGYDVTDAQGREWAVKQGVEGRTEVVVSRLLWAMGYHQPLVYYVPSWTLSRDGKDTLEEGGRFRLESAAEHKIGSWSWRRNPFLSTRQMAGLFVLMVMVNNWDLKTEQNALYEVPSGTRTRHLYVARDLGASFGSTGWFAVGTKDRPDEFDKERFIKRVQGNRVQFHYQGSWREPQLHASVTPDDVRWMSKMLSRLSEQQWRDAFRAGGFEEREAAPYIRRMQEKVAEGLNLNE